MPRHRLVLLALAAALVLTQVAFAPAPAQTAPVGADAEVHELSQPQPSWYTDDLHQDVLAAAEDGAGVAVPEAADVEASALAFTGIRPGSWMVSPAGCTLNFVFGSLPEDDTLAAASSQQPAAAPDRDQDHPSSNGSGTTSSGTYIGTAGHCTEVGDEVSIVAAPGVVMNIGTTVTSVDNGIGDDFALIEIRPEMVQHVNPSTAYFGGPTSAGDPQFGDVVEHAGHGLVIGTGGTPRAGLTVYRGEGDTQKSDAFAWDGAATPGDSGSFVLEADGTAAGDLTHLVVGGPYVPGVIAGTSIDRMLEIAGAPLVTAPIGPDPTS